MHEPTRQAFGPRAALIFKIVSITTIIAVIGWFFVGHRLTQIHSVGPDTYSKSAIGYSGFKSLLAARGFHVHVSRSDTAVTSASAGLLIIAEPRLEDDDDIELFREMVNSAPATLVILPKRIGKRSKTNPDFIGSYNTVSDDAIVDVFRVVLESGEVSQLDSATNWNPGRFDHPPKLVQPQLIANSDHGSPLIAADEGDFAIATVNNHGDALYIVSDPDLFANHGLDEPGNPQLAMDLIAEMVAGDGGIVFDETLHGHTQAPSLGEALTRWPLIVATLQFLLLGLVLLWASLFRFGTPIAPRFAPPLGKELVIQNTAELMRYGGHDARAIERYVEMQLDEVARYLRAPEHLTGWERVGWLERQAAKQNVHLDVKSIFVRAQDASLNTGARKRPLLNLARTIHQWKEDLLDDA